MSDQPYFHVADPLRSQMLGGFKAKNASELCSGKLAVLNSDGPMQQATATDKPDGFCFNNRYLKYAPTSFYADAAEYVTLVAGEVLALVGADLFVGGTLPSAGDNLYSAAGGLIDVNNGTNPIGRCIGTQTIRSAPNSTTDVVLILAHFGGKDK